MNNKQIKQRVSELLLDFSCWEQPKNITDNMQNHALSTMQEVLSLLEIAKPNNKKRSFHSYFFDYIYQLYQIEYEMKKGCYYNACYELYSIFRQVPIFEKQILLNTIDVLRKNLLEVNTNVFEKETQNL